MRFLFLYVVLLSSVKVLGCSISGETSPCKVSTYRYTTQSGMNNYFWQVPTGGTKVGGGGSSQNYVDVVWNGGTGVVNVSYYNANWTQCSSSLNIAAPKENPYPTGITSPSTAAFEMCQTNSIKEYVTDLNKSEYYWTVSGGTIQPTSSSTGYGQGYNKIKVVWNTTGTKYVAVRYKHPNGCTSPQKTVNVVIHPTPVNSITGDYEVCVDGNPYTTNSYVMPSGHPTYYWGTDGTGQMPGGSTINPVTINWTSTSSPRVYGHFVDSHGCPSNFVIKYVWASTNCRTLNQEELEEVTGAEVVLDIVEELDEISFYPIPVKTELNIRIPAEVEVGAEILLINLTGQVVYSCHKAERESIKVIDTSPLKNGWYLARIVSKSGIKNSKILVDH